MAPSFKDALLKTLDKRKDIIQDNKDTSKIDNKVIPKIDKLTPKIDKLTPNKEKAIKTLNDMLMRRKQPNLPTEAIASSSNLDAKTAQEVHDIHIAYFINKYESIKGIEGITFLRINEQQKILH